MRPRTFLTGVCYEISEWDDSTAKVLVRPCRSVVTRLNQQGEPAEFWGGEVLMLYEDGTCHRVSYKYFLSLNPRLWCPPGYLVVVPN